MSILQWNMCGYRRKYTELRQLISDFMPGCICLQETMLGAYTPRPPSGYSILTSAPNNEAIPGQGLATLIHSSLPYAEMDINTNLQALAIRVGFPQQITICNIYLNPINQVTYQDLYNLIQQLPTPFILLGDFNGKHALWGNDTDDARGRLINDLVLAEDACIMNTGSPTHFHVQTGTTSAIDLSICSPQLMATLKWKSLEETYGSDHFPILIENDTNNTLPKKPIQYNLKRAKWKEFTDMTVFQEELPIQSIDQDIDTLYNLIYTAADATIPKTSDTIKSRRVPWWTPQCHTLLAERKRALRRYQRSKLVADKILYKHAKARAAHFIGNLRKKSWTDFISSITSETPMSKIWTKIRKIKGNYPPNHPPCLHTQQDIVSDSKAVSDLLADHYRLVSSSENYPNEFNRVREVRETRDLNFDTDRHEMYNSVIMISELKGVLKTCSDSAPGQDLISYSMIKHLHESSLNLLLYIMNKIWREGVFPTKWKKAIILSFLKPGKNPHQVSSYRPIALTSCVCKLMEKIINIRLVRTLESTNIISDLQFGFRRQRSTIDSLIRLHTDILETFERKEHLVALFFDIQKAYDTVWRYGILEVLHNSNIRGPMALFIKNFLQERTFQTRIGSTLSETNIQEQGVPQGSVLSCTLFLLAVNGILTTLPQHTKASLYVDDLVVYTSSNHIPSIERRLQVAINRVSSWATNHGFRFSIQKSIAVHFHRKRGLQREPSLLLYGDPVQFKDSARYLGMIFDQRLRWKQHLESLKAKATKAIDILKTTAKTKWGGDRATLLRLYRSLIRSKLDYGCFIYWSASDRIIKKLDPVHNTAIRLCTGAFRSSPVTSLYAETGEQSLYYRRQQLALQFYTRTLQNQNVPTYNFINNGRNTPNTFRSLINEFMEQANIGNMQIMKANHLNEPIWTIPMVVCNCFSYPKKTSSSDIEMKQLFYTHLNEAHDGVFQIYTDGSMTDDSVGYAVVAGRDVLKRRLLNDSGIYTAELLAILEAVIYVRDHATINNSVIFSDSRSAVMAVDSYNSYHPIICNIKSVILQIQRIPKQICICWVPAHVGISGNERADNAAREAASSDDPPYNLTTPFRDYFPIFKQKIKRTWQAEWDAAEDNKLHKIKNTIAPWSSSNQKTRHQEVILCRIRIGHTLFSHGHLMERRHPPYCEDCLVPITVKHVLAECPSNTILRLRWFPNTNNIMDIDEIMQIMLGETQNGPFNIAPLVSYLRDINMYTLI